MKVYKDKMMRKLFLGILGMFLLAVPHSLNAGNPRADGKDVKEVMDKCISYENGDTSMEKPSSSDVLVFYDLVNTDQLVQQELKKRMTSIRAYPIIKFARYFKIGYKQGTLDKGYTDSFLPQTAGLIELSSFFSIYAEIYKLPRSLEGWKEMHSLTLNIDYHEIPESIFELPALNFLVLHHVRMIPDSISKLKNLKKLTLFGLESGQTVSDIQKLLPNTEIKINESTME